MLVSTSIDLSLAVTVLYAEGGAVQVGGVDLVPASFVVDLELVGAVQRFPSEDIFGVLDVYPAVLVVGSRAEDVEFQGGRGLQALVDHCDAVTVAEI